MTTNLDTTFSTIGGLFHHLEPSSYAPAKKETQLADLILGYAEANKSYNRVQLHKDYEIRAVDPLQAKALTVVDMNSADKRTKVQTALRQWNVTARQEYQKYSALSSSTLKGTKESKDFAAKCQYFEDLMAVIGVSKMEVNPKNNIAAVVDKEGTIQAISITNPDMFNPGAWHVEYLMSAPHNHIEGSKSRVAGAGSALIEDALVKAIRRQKLNPDTTLNAETLKKTAVTLEGSFSKGFYQHLYFEEEGPKGDDNLILKGDHLFEFLEKYGGRAAFQS